MGGGIIAAIKAADVLASLWHNSAAGWTKVPCVIREFEVVTDFNHRKTFRVKAAYDYHVGGTTRSSRQVWPGEPATGDYEDISQCIAALTAKSPRPPADLRNFETECLVDPEDPTRAVLTADLESVAFGFGVTAAVLLWIGAFLFFYRRQPVSTKARVRRDPILLAFFLFFAVCGVAVSAFTAWGLAERWRMRRWVEVPATVVKSQLQQSQSRNRGRDPGVRASILYRYEIDGREYLSNRTTVLGAYSGNKSSGKLVRSHSPGTAIRVFIDPDKPWRAVVDRNLGWSGFLLLFPLPFLALGGFGVARCSWPKQTRSRR